MTNRSNLLAFRVVLCVVGCCLVAVGCSSGASKSSAPSTSAISAPTASTTTVRAGTTVSTATTATTPTDCAAGAASKGGGSEASTPGDIPDSQAFISFTPSTGRYAVDIPEGWARTDTTNHVHFTQKLVDIDIRLVPKASAPTVASVRSEELDAITRSARCVKITGITLVSRRSAMAIRVAYQADSEPDPVTGKVVRDDVERYEIWHVGTEAIITLAAPAGSDNVDVWRRITDSLRWV